LQSNVVVKRDKEDKEHKGDKEDKEDKKNKEDKEDKGEKILCMNECNVVSYIASLLIQNWSSWVIIESHSKN
jgi:hypothetical protein